MIKGAVCSAFFLCKVVFISIRYNVMPCTGWCALPSIKKKTQGEKIVAVLQALGPTFVKLGQSLSSRVDIVGEEIAASLLTLCDRVPPFAHQTAIEIIESELSRNIQEMFSEFADSPVAAASIAQVYKAKLLSGETVAVKILRPSVDKLFARDITILQWLAERATAFKKLQRLQLPAIIETFAAICKFELDLRFEAANAEELYENTKNDRGFRVPKVYWKHTTQQVMTTEWIDGIPIYETDRLRNPEKIAENLVLTFCNQCYRDCFFHADMHPGNLLVDQNDNLVAVDFGIMGRLSKMTGIYVAEILSGFLRKDYRYVAEIHVKAGYVDSIYRDDFMSACRAIGAPIVGEAIADISAAKLLAQLFKITSDFNMQVQPQLALLQKTMVLIEGICRNLHPNINIWKIAESWIQANSKSRYIEQLKHLHLIRTARKVPTIIDKIDRALDLMIKNNRPKQSKNGMMILISILIIVCNVLFWVYQTQ